MLAMKTLLYLALLVCVLEQVNTQPLRKTNWRILSNDATTTGYSYPRVASFSSGNYAAIFGYSAPSNMSGTRILRLNATTGMNYEAVFEIESSLFGSPGDASVGPLTAQNLFIFPGNSAYAVWQTAGTAKIFGAQLMEFGALVSTIFYSTDPGNWKSTDYVDIVGTSWQHYSVAFSTAILSRISFAEPFYGTESTKIFSAQSIHSAVGTKPLYGYPAIYSLVTYSASAFGLNQTFVNTSSYTSGYVTNCANGIPFVMDDLDVVGALFVTYDGQIQLLVFSIPGLFQLYSFQVVSSGADPNFVPSVLNISSNIVLIAYSSSDKRINYQMVKLSRTSAVLVGPQVTHDAVMTTQSVSIANTIGSDIVVVAKDVTGTQVMSRTITFCGNNALDLKEECDGSQGCMSDCKCQTGTLAVNGTCVDQCKNGIVTGQEQCDSGTGCVECKCAQGYRSTSPRSQSCEVVPKEFVPNVKPLFDCLDVSSNGYTLHFSYINNDGFDEAVPYGALNSFTPASLGANRPSIFIAGQSLTYPLSPYSVGVPSDTQSVTWILTSYNLIIDLTNTAPLQCPKDLRLTLTVSTSGNLTDTLVQKLLQNIALKYNISESRLSANYTLVSTDAQGLNEYVIVVTIGDAPNSTEKPSTEVVKDILDDLQNSKNTLNSDLTQGLEEVNPVIKNVTPAIVQTRGQAAPNSGFTPVALEPTSNGTKVKGIIWSLIVVLLLFVY